LLEIYQKEQPANITLENTRSSIIKRLKIRKYTVWAKTVVFGIQADDTHTAKLGL